MGTEEGWDTPYERIPITGEELTGKEYYKVGEFSKLQKKFSDKRREELARRREELERKRKEERRELERKDREIIYKVDVSLTPNKEKPVNWRTGQKRITRNEKKEFFER